MIELKRPRKDLLRFIWNFGLWTRDDSFLWSDPKPFFVDLRQMVKKLAAQSFDIIGKPESQETPR